MTRYVILYDQVADDYTGRPWHVSCYEDDSFIWSQYCKTRQEADLITGPICSVCGCADFKKYANICGKWEACLNCGVTTERK